jgi:hypothetical protein
MLIATAVAVVDNAFVINDTPASAARLAPLVLSVVLSFMAITSDTTPSRRITIGDGQPSVYKIPVPTPYGLGLDRIMKV